jgi:hypothetical protein
VVPSEVSDAKFLCACEGVSADQLIKMCSEAG